jgi:hypothetical protein
LSSANTNLRLQTDFVMTELETGYRMLGLAVAQRGLRREDDAAQSLSLALVALTGAERHMVEVKLPRTKTRDIVRRARELRDRIDGFEGRAA